MRADFTKTPIDLIAVVLLSLILGPIIGLAPDSALRIILGLPFVLFFPGYALIGALFVKKKDLDAIERLALSFGLSIAITPLIGLALNYTFSIRLEPILASLLIFIVAMSALAAYRRANVPEAERFALVISIDKKALLGESRIDKILTAILVIAIIAAVATLVYVIATPKTGERFTQFYVLASDGMAADYPAEMGWNESGTVIVGFTCNEHAQTHYRWDALLHNESIYTEYVTLDNGETYETNFTFSISHPSDCKLEFLLFKDADESALHAINATAAARLNGNEEWYEGAVYRDLHLWVRDFYVLTEENGTLQQPLAEKNVTLNVVNNYLEKVGGEYVSKNYEIVIYANNDTATKIYNASFAVYNQSVTLPVSLNLSAYDDAAALDVVVYMKGDYAAPYREAVIVLS